MFEENVIPCSLSDVPDAQDEVDARVFWSSCLIVAAYLLLIPLLEKI